MSAKNPQTVGDLIAALSKFPQDMRVLVSGDAEDGDYADPSPLFVLRVETNKECVWRGWYTEDGMTYNSDGTPAFAAVVVAP